MNSMPEWAEPGAYRVDDNVFRIPLPLPQDGLRAVNVYLLETAAGPVMIDGGWALQEARDALVRALRAVGFELRDITEFLVTHAHRDHYSLAAVLRQEFPNVRIGLGAGERPTLRVLQAPEDGWTDPSLLGLVRSGAHELAKSWVDSPASRLPDPAQWQDPDFWLEDDQVLAFGAQELLAVATPGHTQGHFVFAEQEAGLLFAGDHVLPTITPSIGFEVAPADQPLADFLRSLAKVRAMPDMTLLPAHGPVAPSVHARVAELLAHHEERLALCRQAVEAGHDTAYAVAEQLPWTRRGRRLEALDLFNAALATLETLAHLDVLRSQGALVSEEVEEVQRWTPTPGDRGTGGDA